MIGSEYLSKIDKTLRHKFKRSVGFLLKDGIGDQMDKGNLWIAPGFTILAFAILWTTKLSKLALAEATCKSASIYDFTDTQLDRDAQRHCETAKRYYVDINEPFLYDQKWREARQVKNPEWVLWFWAPIVFVMYVLTRFIWSLLLENQGINFHNVVNAAQSVTVENDGVTEVDEDKLQERVQVMADNFRCATSSHAFAAFIVFELTLVLIPFFLLTFVLPLMIGAGYRTWGLDVAKAWWEKVEWKGAPLTPLLWRPPAEESYGGVTTTAVVVPLIPRITYCDYHYLTIGNNHVVTYRCYLDANWHERTALFTWTMLTFLTFINLCNLLFWLKWAFLMRRRNKRAKWVLQKWLNGSDGCGDDLFPPGPGPLRESFAKQFSMGNILLFYYIEAHTDRVVASAFCTALFQRWLEAQQQRLNEDSFRMTMPSKEDSADGDVPKPPPKIGWDLESVETVGDGVYTPGPFEATPTPQLPPTIGYSTASTTRLLEEPKDTPRRPLLASAPPRSSSSTRSMNGRRGGSYHLSDIGKGSPGSLEPLGSSKFFKKRSDKQGEKGQKKKDGDGGDEGGYHHHNGNPYSRRCTII